MNFKEQKRYIESTNKVDMSKFDKVTDVTKMIDFINNEVERKNKEHAEGEIHEISKFLARNMGRKMFILKAK